MWWYARTANLAFRLVPKAACTTGRLAVVAADEPDEVREHLETKKTGSYHFLRAREDRYLKKFRDVPSGATLCSAVRDPFSRIKSAYRNKLNFQVRNDPNPERAKARFDEWFERQLAPHGFTQGMPFGDFIDLLCRTPDNGLDGHLRSQSAMLMHKGKMLPQAVAKIEEPETFKGLFPDRCAFVFERPTNRSNPIESSRFDLSAAQRAAFVERFARDYEIFGYEPGNVLEPSPA